MLQKVLGYIRERDLLRAGDRVAVAVSGGADSVALLRLLVELRPELGVVLAIAHFNHGLRGEQSMADEAFVADLAKQHSLEFFSSRADVRDHASVAKLSIEAAGRELRYRWFEHLAQEQRFDCIATAHTRDDQAETVLLKFLRGAGSRGLAGIYPQRWFARSGRDTGQARAVRIVRPLLCAAREEVECYLTALSQPWREDESNLDRRFLRNRVRHDLLPLLQREYNPNLRQLLSDLAEVSQAEQDYWNELVPRHLKTNDSGDLVLEGFAGLPVALQRRVLKSFAETSGPALDFQHVEKLRRCALGKRRKAELPGDRIAMRANGTLKICPSRPDHC